MTRVSHLWDQIENWGFCEHIKDIEGNWPTDDDKEQDDNNKDDDIYKDDNNDKGCLKDIKDILTQYHTDSLKEERSKVKKS